MVNIGALLLSLLFLMGSVIGCNDDSSKTNVAPTETAVDKNGSVQGKGTDKSGATDDEEETEGKGTVGKTEDQSSDNGTSEALTESGETAQTNPCQPIVDEANKQEQAGKEVDEEQFQKDLNECVTKNASVMSEVLAAEEEYASKAAGSEDSGELNKAASDRGCATGCYDRNCPFVNLDKIRCVPESAAVKATADQPSDSR